jgi:HEAT repeat protein
MLGHNVLPFTETEGALLRLVEDHNEYVSRMALQALGRIGSKRTEGLCERAWATNHEYQRIMALWVLKEIGSPKLSSYLALAKEDGRKYVVSNAVEIGNELTADKPDPTASRRLTPAFFPDGQP